MTGEKTTQFQSPEFGAQPASLENSTTAKTESKAPVTQNLRRQLRQKRRSLSSSEQRRHSALIVRHLRHNLAFLKARRVGIYWPNDGEVNLAKLLGTRRKQFYWPVLQERVHPWRGPGLLFARAGFRWRSNRYGIPEPTGGKLLRARDLDFILLPVVGFDKQGNRLGMGGGYYDRSLAGVPHWKSVTLMGVAHEIQRVSDLTRENWDIAMTAVATEAGISIK